MPRDHYGSGSYQGLRPLLADDGARPPSAAGTGDRPFLPPVEHDEPAVTERAFDPRARAPAREVDEDSEPTSPLPVILPGAASIPRPAQVETPRGPFEPARPTRQTSVTGSVEPPPSPVNGAQQAAVPLETAVADELGRSTAGSVAPLSDDVAQPLDEPPGWPIPEAASAKLEQIRDLYLTAEAIGEEALNQHFDQVSERQRELIREFFQQSHPANGDAP
jgi:hypothetical protein